MNNNNFFIITGGPGSGKTSIINELKKRDYNCIEESARRVIQEQVYIGGNAVPWENLRHFKDLIVTYSIESYKLAMQTPDKITFFDGSIIDIVAYNRIAKIKDSKYLQNAIQIMHFNKKAFLAPPWKEIYHTDPERKQSYEEAVSIYNIIIQVYTEYGYKLIELPKTDIAIRADFIINKISS